MSESHELRWGVIGTGGIAAAFATDLGLTGSGTVVAVGSRSQDSADSFGARHGVARRHASYAALVEDPEVDVVYVATPHPWHHEHALLALGAGKPVLVEKPFAMSAAEGADIAAAAREQGLFAMEAMWTRFLPHIVALREILAAGELGQLVVVSADHGQWFPRDPSHRLFDPALGGGALLDLGVYPVSFASMILGTPDRVLAVSTPAMTGVDGTTSILLHHPSGAQAVLSTTSAARTSTSADVVGTEGRVEIDGPFYRPSRMQVIPREGELRLVGPESTGHGLRFQAEEVARCLAAGLTESPVMPLAETLSIAATMDAVLAQV